MSNAQKIHDDTVQQAKALDIAYGRFSDEVVDKSLKGYVTVLEEARALDPFTYTSVVKNIQSAHADYMASLDTVMNTLPHINKRLAPEEQEAIAF